MAEFVYSAVDEHGKRKTGNVLAENATLALDKLRSQDLYPTKISPASFWNRSLDISIGKAVNNRTLGVFCRQFVSMLSAGVTIVESLEMLADQTENKHLARALNKVQEDIMQGESLADAMRAHKNIFPEMLLNLVAAGEASGKLEASFERMADYFEKSGRVEAQMRKAAIYPIIVGIVSLVVMAIMLIRVVPSYAEMFESLDTEMPAITLAVMAISDFLVGYWYIILGIIVAVVIGVRYYNTTEKGKKSSGKFAISVPLLGDLNIKTISSMTARTLSTMTYAGVPLIEALVLTSHTMNNELYREALMKASNDVREGVSLSQSLRRSGLYPPMVSHMVGVGEETGEFEDMLTKLAEYYDEEVEMTTQTVMAALEPMIILILAAIVGVIIAACMAPMITMYSNMGNL